MDATSPADLSALDARRRIGNRSLSPVELLDACIDRIEAVDHAVNAVVSRDFERARETAKRAEAEVMRGGALGLLHGLPIGIKDLNPTAGLRTTWGSELYADHVPAADDLLVRMIREAGGIVVGKTNTPEFGAGANTWNRVFGATGNPFDPMRSAAGSSGGSAVALATGMMPLASGSDLGGSLRNPAAYSGIFGFRPSQGAVPVEDRALAWSILSVQGPMARNAQDCALFLQAMYHEDGADPLSRIPRGRVFPLAERDPATLRVAFTEDFGIAPTSRLVRETFRARTSRFRDRFARAVDGTWDCAGADDAFAVLRAGLFLGSHLDRYRNHRDRTGPNVVANVEEGLGYSLEDHVRALATQSRIYRSAQAFFAAGVDLVISPAMTVSPRPWTELYPHEIDGVAAERYFSWLALPYAVTLTGCPAACLPCGLDPLGMPFGLQLVGPPGSDGFVLEAAAALERLFAGDAELGRPKPDLERLRAAPDLAQTTRHLVPA